jgi:3-oxoacyl-[acyl-carrier protein] reductase
VNPRTTVITGASRGIGFSIAKRLASVGQTVIGIARNKPEEEFPGELFFADLNIEQETNDVLQKIDSTYSIDNVINNVGVANPQALDCLDLQTFYATIEFNLGLAVKVTQTFLPAMRSKKRGRILNISSRAALGRKFRTGYSAAKSGMIGMTRSWALELAEDGITANVLAPGLTDTEMMRSNNSDIDSQEAAIPMKRLGRPDEIAAAAEFLVSDSASYVTGQVLFVCGGLSVGFAHF